MSTGALVALIILGVVVVFALIIWTWTAIRKRKSQQCPEGQRLRNVYSEKDETKVVGKKCMKSLL